MSAKIGRNDPCPCGSGKKYKHCHLGASDDPGKRELPPTTEEVAAQAAQPAAPLPQWMRYAPWAVGAVGLLASLGLYVNGTEGSWALAGGTVAVVGLWLLLSDPPPPKDDAGDPAALNFGRRE